MENHKVAVSRETLKGVESRLRGPSVPTAAAAEGMEGEERMGRRPQ